MTAIAIAAALAIIGALVPELRWLHYASKPLATLLVVALVASAQAGETHYRRAVVAGLVLSAVGDVFLMLPTMPGAPDWFVFGLASFLCAHVAYLVAFCARARLLSDWRPFAGYSLLAGGVLAVLWPHLPGPLRAPVVVYVVLLAAMAAQSAVVWLRWRDGTSRLAALGGAFFVASDATLAIDRFVSPFPAAIVVVLVTYWTAQALIGLSATRVR